MPAKFRTSIKIDGPFFRHDPMHTFRSNAAKLIYDVVNEGRKDVIGQLAGGNAGRAEIKLLGDHVSEHVVSGMKRVSGAPPRGSVYVRNEGLSAKQGKSLMAAASRVESKTHAFRKTAGRLKRARAANFEELLRGLQ